MPRWLLYLAISSTSILGIFAAFSYQEYLQQREHRLHDDGLRLQQAVDLAATHLGEIIRDLRRLARAQSLIEYLEKPDPLRLKAVQMSFVNLTELTERYVQVRWLDARGMERIRIDYREGQARIAEHLQDKSSRYYFLAAARLPPDQVYISPLDLNVEQGRIEQPYRPMLRVAIPVYRSIKLAGVLILNYRADRLLSEFRHALRESWGEAMILNQQGYWLSHSQPALNWGFTLPHQCSFARDFPAAWTRIQSAPAGMVSSAEGTFIWQSLPLRIQAPDHVHTDQTNQQLLFVSHITPEQDVYSLFQVANRHPQTFWLLLLASSLISLVLAGLRKANIQKTRELKVNESRHHNMLENMADGYALQQVIFDHHGKPCDFRYLEINPAFERILGLKRADVVGKTVLEILPSTEVYWIETFARVATTGQPARLEQFGGFFDRHFEIMASSPEYGLVAVFFADVTERKRNEDKLRQAATVFDNTLEAITITDAELNILTVNDAYTRITGYSQAEAQGRNPSMQKSGLHNASFYQEMWQNLIRHGQWQGEIWNRRKNGELYPAWENISVIRDATGNITNYVSIMSDISPVKQAEEQLLHLAHHDPLTGLANRLAFVTHLEQTLERARRRKQRMALLFLDLDRFKLINDTLGHAIGDHLLQIIARRLKQNVRAEDMVTRLGGDEFTILLEDIKHPEDAALLAEKLIQVISEPIRLDEREINTSTSIGISIYPQDADTAGDLAKTADAAMYRAKNHGRHNYQFYTVELTLHAEERLAIENDLRRALKDNELVLFYQPQFDSLTDRICGVEALLRWQHPTRGLLLPTQFIGIAEDSRLIDSIGQRVINLACAQFRDWHKLGINKLRLAINLSGHQIIYDHAVEAVSRAVHKNRLNLEDINLELEITESVLQAGEHAIDTLHRLRQMGVSIAIDDFGTGYSSLSHLQHLPINTLKIDRAFLRNIPEDSNNKALTAAIVALGHSLDLRVVAEGVENVAQLSYIQSLGCNEYQGFYKAEALSADKIPGWYERYGSCHAKLVNTQAS